MLDSVLNNNRGMVCETGVIASGSMNLVIACNLGKLRGCYLVVNSPASVSIKGLTSKGPPGVWARLFRMLRPTDIAISAADPSRARLELGWSASSDMPEVVARMCRESLV
jgi:hypothetical protein